MPTADNVSQQLQPYLPGMEHIEPAPEKQPHQMSPQEFAEHPYAVFHSTHLPHEDLFNPAKRFGKTSVVHFGTEQAALDRHNITGDPRNRALEGKGIEESGHLSDARLHVMWHKPTSLDVVTDSPANDYAHGTRYYKNAHEDMGSISLATSEPEQVKSQHQYVQEAIAAGKRREVHPATLDMYNRGLLQKGAWLPLSHTRRFATPTVHAADFDPMLKAPEGDDSFHEIGPDYDPHIGWYAESQKPRTRPEDIGTRGPNLDRIKAQLEKDAQK